MKRHRVVATVAVVGAVLLGVMFIPLPHNIKCVLEVAPRDAESVYADVPGRLEEALVRPGEQVTAGQKLARVENLDLQLTVVSLEGRRAETLAQLENLRQLRFRDPQAIGQIPEIEEMLATVTKQLDEKTAQLERLSVKAPISGTVLPPPVRPDRPSSDGRLPGWSGSPLEPKNRGARLGESDLICQVGDPRNWEVVLVIDQADIELIRLDQEVSIKLDAYPGRTYSSTIEAIADSDLKFSPASLTSQAGGELETRTDPSGMSRPISTSYQAKAPLETSDEVLRMGLRGRAKVHTGWQPLGKRLYRYLARTFHFQL